MNLLDILIHQQRMVMVCILNDHIKNLNLMEQQYHQHHLPVILIVDFTIKCRHIHHQHRCIRQLTKCMPNHPYHQVHLHHHKSIIYCFINSTILRSNMKDTWCFFFCLKIFLSYFLFSSSSLVHTYIAHHSLFSLFCCCCCSYSFVFLMYNEKINIKA